jgi:serine/threonine-protein kinase
VDPTGPATTDTTTATAATSESTTTTAAPPRVVVPDVVGLLASDAVRKLRDAKLRPAIHLVGASGSQGTVLAQKPDSAAKLAPGAVVELRVAKRPRATKVDVPSLVGSPVSSAKSRLRWLGLHVSVSTEVSHRPRGTVVAQSPSAGTEVAKGVGVQLTVSSGPAQVSGPDVTGLDEASARAQLADAGFSVSVVDQPASDPSQDGMVIDQNPTGGSSSDKGSTVTITVARAV